MRCKTDGLYKELHEYFSVTYMILKILLVGLGVQGLKLGPFF
jgi:hypothetical protein